MMIQAFNAATGSAPIQGPDQPCPAPDPLGIIEEEHALQLELCDMLEAIADGLPSIASPQLADIAARILKTSWPTHIGIEDTYLFPLLRERAGKNVAALNLFDCLEQDHSSDEDQAIEIVHALELFLAEGQVRNPDMLGYMLRGFFTSQRRHIALENSVMLPLARDLLTQSDLQHIQACIMGSDNPRCVHVSRVELRSALAAAPCQGCSSQRSGA